jgi:hypothetical protein
MKELVYCLSCGKLRGCLIDDVPKPCTKCQDTEECQKTRILIYRGKEDGYHDNCLKKILDEINVRRNL